MEGQEDEAAATSDTGEAADEEDEEEQDEHTGKRGAGTDEKAEDDKGLDPELELELELKLSCGDSVRRRPRQQDPAATEATINGRCTISGSCRGGGRRDDSEPRRAGCGPEQVEP